MEHVDMIGFDDKSVQVLNSALSSLYYQFCRQGLWNPMAHLIPDQVWRSGGVLLVDHISAGLRWIGTHLLHYLVALTSGRRITCRRQG